jgi:hypothetical protein
VTPEEAQDTTNAYLLPDLEDDEEQASFIRFRAKKLFEHELEAVIGSIDPVCPLYSG